MRGESMRENRAIIGRKAEQEILSECFKSNKSEFIALYGRRRVGKTFLVREALGPDFVFYASGILDGNIAVQIENFNREIADFGGNDILPAKNWHEACEMKYASSEYTIDKAYDMNLRNKRSAFVSETRTRKAAQTTMITTYGLRKNAYQAGVPFEVILDDLFEA